jgi:hypothetical protein
MVAGAAITTGADTATVEGSVHGLVILVGGVLAVGLQALVLFATSALITLFMDVEHNTRATAEMVATLAQPY